MFLVEEVFVCKREPSNCHSDWAIVVMKPEMREVASHVPDDLACVLIPLLTFGVLSYVLSMKCEVTGLSKAAEEGVWVQDSGIVIPYTYVLYNKKVDRADELNKSCKKKKQMKDTESEPVEKRKRLL